MVHRWRWQGAVPVPHYTPQVEFLLGVDGGGTKTELIAASRWGGALARVRVGASSLSRSSPDAVASELARGGREVFSTLGADATACVAVCAGFASAGQHGAAYEHILAGLFPGARCRVMTDAELALRAAAGAGDGIVVIAGTGSIAWGRYAGRSARAGGTTPGNDPGSGDWIRHQLARPGVAATTVYGEAGLALAQLLLRCARALAWPTPAAYYHGGVVTHIPEVLASLAGAWPHSLAPLPCSPAEAALELARRELAR